MLKTWVSDDFLRNVEHYDTLFSLYFNRNHYVSTTENIAEHGCYLVFDIVRGKFVRAGLASAKLRHKDAKGVQCGRANGNMKSSTKH